MTVDEYCEYISNRDPLADPKARVVALPSGEAWTTLRLFYKERNGAELRLSGLVSERGWLPMPDEVFDRVRGAQAMPTLAGRPVVLLGLPGYLALLTEENRRATVFALREWLDETSGRDAVCLLGDDNEMQAMLGEVFANPRYREGKQLVGIEAGPDVSGGPAVASASSTNPPDKAENGGQPTEVTLVGGDLAPLIPEVGDTFQKYLQYTEDHPGDSTPRRIVVASEGKQLAGLSAEVCQVVSLRDFALSFHGVSDPTLSEEALWWMCERGKESAGRTLSEALRARFFAEGEMAERVLKVFDRHKGYEREAAFWLIRHTAPKGSYLEYVTRQQGVDVGNFRSAYITGAAGCLDSSPGYATERKQAVWEAGVTVAGAAILQFIARCTNETTSRVGPWLNCETDAERAELLRRCAADGVVSNVVKSVYPETAAYLGSLPVFGDQGLAEYFAEYRELKLTGHVTQEFCGKAIQSTPPSTMPSRDTMLQSHALDEGCALLVVDAMGAEWLPMLVELARRRNIGVESAVVGTAQLPTTTSFNGIHWPDKTRQLADIKRFDNIAHHGVETHEAQRAEENLAEALGVIGERVLPRVADGLAHFERVLVTADHGSSRLALLAWRSEPKLAQTLSCEEGADVADWRYRKSSAQAECPPELRETLDGEHWVVPGYDRLPKKGGGQGFELHGGATLEEWLVPVILFSRMGHFVPRVEAGGRAQIVENDDFDL
ncbi:MAG: BREX-4 system phosphatase PglZ [Victivallales bacterium]|nr:BREX-4 system phosphatase PglZ [Verrucomicrobiota bacterium]MBT7300142.1 BREX-4 system phosphatase PglZ [Victivallales bacterium]